MSEEYGKLVRDGIPAKIKDNGEKPITRELSSDEFKEAIIQKIHEEADELALNFSVKELIDLAELVKTARDLIGINSVELEEARVAKSRRVGAFATRTYLEGVE
jgi:predicted house-cleaning noncanonical NTP pyrophosphatase (MazG superfamily)